jgi:hypothetical protein
MRIVLASVLLAAALSGAAALHGYTETHTFTNCAPSGLAPIPRSGGLYSNRTCVVKKHPGWADPLAIFLAVAGIGSSAAVLTSRRH